jgi:hypothetical protein
VQRPRQAQHEPQRRRHDRPFNESSWRNNSGKSPGSVAKFDQLKLNVTDYISIFVLLYCTVQNSNQKIAFEKATRIVDTVRAMITRNLACSPDSRLAEPA